MNRSSCACHTVVLCMFMRSLAGPAARQPFTLTPTAAHVFADQQADGRGQGPMRAVRARTAASYAVARFHTGRPRYGAQAAAAAAAPEAEPIIAEPAGATASGLLTSDETTQDSLSVSTSTEPPISETTREAQDAAQDAAPQYPGKNRRKKERRQREAEAAAAAAAAAAGTPGTDKGALTSVTDAAKSTIVSTAAGVAGASSVPRTATTEMKEMTARPQKSTGGFTKKEKGTKAMHAKETKAEKNVVVTEQGEDEERTKRRKKKKEKKQKAESAPSPLPREPWQVQKRALREKFQGEAWNPRKKLSPDALEGIRALHKQMPDVYTTPVLARHFAVSPEAIRRILKSKWQPSVAEEEDRQERWFERGKKVWQRWAALGKKPPKRWQAEGIQRDNPRRLRQQEDRTRRQLRAAWQREEMGAMGRMGMLEGESGASGASDASGASGAAAASGHSREPAFDHGTDGPPSVDQPRQSASLGKRIRLSQQSGRGKQ